MKADRDKINAVKEELKDMYPDFSGFIEHTLVATMCKEYHEAKVKDMVVLDGVSNCVKCGEREGKGKTKQCDTCLMDGII